MCIQWMLSDEVRFPQPRLHFDKRKVDVDFPSQLPGQFRAYRKTLSSVSEGQPGNCPFKQFEDKSEELEVQKHYLPDQALEDFSNC